MRALGDGVFDDDSFPGMVWQVLPQEDKDTFTSLRSAFFSETHKIFQKIVKKIYRFVFRNSEFSAERGIVSGFYFCGPFYLVDLRQLKKFVCLSKGEIQSGLAILGYRSIKTNETDALLPKIFPQLEKNEFYLRRWEFFSATYSTKKCYITPMPDIGFHVMDIEEIKEEAERKKEKEKTLYQTLEEKSKKVTTKHILPKPLITAPPPPPPSPLPSLVPNMPQSDELIDFPVINEMEMPMNDFNGFISPIPDLNFFSPIADQDYVSPMNVQDDSNHHFDSISFEYHAKSDDEDRFNPLDDFDI